MTQTINISLPESLSMQIRKQVKAGGYVSVSEFIREAVRNLIRSSTDFTPQAQKEILKIAKTSLKKDLKFDTEKTPVRQIFKEISQG